MQATPPRRSMRGAMRRRIEASKRIRWDIDRDVIRGREFDLRQKFLPDGLSLIDEIDVLSADQRRFLGQVQGRTYANMFGLVERFIGAKMLEVSRDHWLGDQTALEAIVRFTDEEMKHQELFRRVERLVGRRHAGGLPVRRRRPTTSPRSCSASSTWAVLALTCHIELFSQAHYRESIAERRAVGPVQGHLPVPLEGGVAARGDRRARVGARGREAAVDAARDAAVDDLIALVGGVDGILQAPGRGRRRVLPARQRHRRRRPARGGGRGDGAEGVPLAVHRVGRDPPALPEGPRRAWSRGADGSGSRTRSRR